MKQNNSSYPCLFNICSILESGKNEIISNWMNNPLLITLFLNHRISIDKFTQNFAPGIVEYFINVIKGTKVLGDCPIMSKFVNYMILKDIAPHEVYDICTRFRNELTFYLLNAQNKNSQESVELLQEISIIFDANFSGVLTLFNDFLKKQNSSIEKSIEYKKKFKALSRTIDALDVNVFVVQSTNIILANKHLLETLGVSDLEDFHIKFRKGLDFLKDVSFKGELFAPKTYNTWIEKAATTNEKITASIFDSNSRKDSLCKIKINVLTESEPKKYVFTLINSLFTNEDDEQYYISNIDKLTGLYSYAYFKSYIGNIGDIFESSKYALVVIDVKSLRRVNETLGYEKGDRLIINVAQVIKKMCDTSMIVSRFSGSRMGVLLPNISAQKSYDWAVHLRSELEGVSKETAVSFTIYGKKENSMHVELRAYSLLDSLSFSNKRHVVTDVKDIDEYDLLENQEMFLSRFEKLKEIMDGVLLFKEIIVKSKNKIVKVTERGIFIDVSSRQLAVAKVGDNFYLSSQVLGHIRAVILSVNYKKSILELSRFAFDEHTPLKRKLVRVTRGSSLDIQLIDNDKSMDGEVTYLNEQYISFKFYRKKALKVGKLVFLEINTEGKYLEIEGIVHVLKKDAEAYICVVHLHHTSESNNILRKYIAARQMQIIQELNKLEY
jgi:diguanylate cyclase (GGDEF)-like protein